MFWYVNTSFAYCCKMDKNYTAKIADFDLAKQKNSTMAKTFAGTYVPLYSSLLLFADCITWLPKFAMDCRIHSLAMCMLHYFVNCSCRFSFSMIMHEVYHNRMSPFKSDEIHITFSMASNANFRPEVVVSKPNHQWMVDLMVKSWNHNPAERPTFAQIVAELEEHT